MERKGETQRLGHRQLYKQKKNSAPNKIWIQDSYSQSAGDKHQPLTHRARWEGESVEEVGSEEGKSNFL